jgi:hypothetical protein
LTIEKHVNCQSLSGHTAAALIFPAASTRTGIIPADLLSILDAAIAILNPCHHVGGRPFRAKFRSHEFHSRGDVRKETFIAGAKVIQISFSGGGLGKTMLWAFAIARELKRAFVALARQPV